MAAGDWLERDVSRDKVIIAGSRGGRRIAMPPGDRTRPNHRSGTRGAVLGHRRLGGHRGGAG